MFATSCGTVSQIFTPLNIQNLIAWFDASDTSTITDAGSGAVSQIDDKSGNGNHATQSTGSLRPTTGTTSYLGKNTIKFDLGDALNTSIDLSSSLNDFMISVFSRHDVVDTTYRVVAGQWGPGTGRQYAIGKDNTSEFYGGMFGSPDVLSTVASSVHSVSVSIWDQSSSTFKFYVNNIDYGTSGGAPQETVNNLYIGGAFPGAESFNGRVGDIIIAQHYPSSVILKKLWRREKASWGL